ncbi:phospho-N-acetylmuramoyl-pentapeptide-transferase [Boudabousia liubingyangii]|uniref:Phospho-N-acetylmuramoyl-pentapeptide-transferase n=1 Tax=Boudabousia liubingyangii TaxID=1921764 RepID=A0A1Q5PNE0_9ACTO|nr:phospho-N-acetylmuramoyl-pentapeptide-transferase [Boudabousia liubingyangii]OKL47541.1 phospho-N-acetylmuramoyl-pentapeptide-transferase [Boudabousia liubingyangii]OKL48965.1 phospho-N-acetylmuramoyl-pentapeptide-transferase [Boudabousia liubingyangii]
MMAILVALGSSLLISLFGTPFFIKFLVAREYGQFIRQDGPTEHLTKRGTPTMGGVVIIAATVIGTFLGFGFGGHLPSISSGLVMFLFVGLGVIGFIDDFTKISKQRSLGLNPLAKIIGQVLVGTIFALGAALIPNQYGQTSASMAISVVRDTRLSLAYWGFGIGIVLFLIWVNLLVSAWSNAVNLTDGLDGLATGASMAVFGAYTFISIWQYYQDCARGPAALHACYTTANPLGLAIFCSALVGACFGFLWWNAAPAQIFMGDTGSLALGGAVAAMSIMTHTEFLAIVIGGLFVATVMSDVIQITSFKLTRKRVFKMAPLHHHFELSGWREITIVIRFWLVAGLCAILGVVLFYAEWVSAAR